MDNIKYSVRGIKGYKPEPQKTAGYVCVDLRHKDDYISVDDFQGYGSNYEQRELTQIKIVQNGTILFKGSKYELFEILKSHTYGNTI